MASVGTAISAAASQSDQRNLSECDIHLFLFAVANDGSSTFRRTGSQPVTSRSDGLGSPSYVFLVRAAADGRDLILLDRNDDLPLLVQRQRQVIDRPFHLAAAAFELL